MKKRKEEALYDKMIDLYVQYGLYKEHLISITKKGMDGQQQIAAMMESYRSNPPKSINGTEVVQLLDYELQKGINPRQVRSGRLNYQNRMCCNLYWQMAVADFCKTKWYGTKDQILF